MADERFYSDDDVEVGVTLAQLGQMSADERYEYIVRWFHRNFEDPANETPYESAEGGSPFRVTGVSGFNAKF